MNANKDGGTTVGFSDNTILQQFGIDMEIKHGQKGEPIDFKIPENLEQINKQQWEDIENEFKNERQFEFWSDVFDWLKEKYFAPEKK